MNLILNLSPETEAQLIAKASLVGKKPEDVALEVLREQFSSELVSAPILPPQAWLREFDAWVSGHTSRNPHVDDSREAIYPDRW